MKKNKKKIVRLEDQKVEQIRKRSFNVYIRRSFFYIFICLIICGIFLIFSSSTIYKKQREVTLLKSEINKAVQELESLELEILNLKGFDKVIQYADDLNMISPKLGESIFVDLSKDNFDVERQEEPRKPFIIEIYRRLFGKEDQ